MKKIFVCLVLFLSCYATTANALELVRQKGVATRIVFPLLDDAGEYLSGEAASSPDSEIDKWADGSDPDGFADINSGDEIAELGSTGIYYVTLDATDMNADYIVYKCTTTNSTGQIIFIRTMVGDPANFATTTSGAVAAREGADSDTLETLSDQMDATDTAGEIATAVWNAATGSYGGAGTYGQAVEDVLIDTGTTLQGELDGIQADTEDLQAQIGTDGDGLTAVPWNAAWDAEVESEVDDSIGGGTGTALTAIPYNAAWDAEIQSECTDALNAYDPPTAAELTTAVGNVSVDEIQASALADLFNTDSGTDYASSVAGSVVKEIADNAGGSSLTAEDIVDEWEAQSQADPTGFHVNVMEVNGTAQTANDNGADINAILADTGTDGVVLANDAITAAKIAANAIGASEIADDAIDAGAIAADAIGAAEIADNAIDAGAIAANAITTSEFANDTITADKIADNAFGIEHYQDDIYGFNPWEILGIIASKTAGPKRITINGADDMDLYYYALDDLTAAGTAVILYEEVDSSGQTIGTITITAPF